VVEIDLQRCVTLSKSSETPKQQEKGETHVVTVYFKYTGMKEL
jgi:hypothetical protein